jgi:hypothetical protein
MERAMLFALLVCAVLVLCFRRRKDFVVRAGPGRFECRGRMSLPQQKALAQFLLHDVEVRGPVTIMGRRADGRLHLWFRGQLTPGEQQRIRNVLRLHG